MRKMNFSKYCLTALAFMSLAGCAVEEDTPANRDEKTYLDAWLHVNHPDAEASGYGIYIIDEEEGESNETVENSGYIFVTYTYTDLKGNVSATSDYGTAKQVGGNLFNKSYYYGPNVWTLGEGYQYRGIIDLVTGMKVGGTRKAVIPGWLLSYETYGSEQEYIDNITGNSPRIYEVKVWDKTDDITQWEIDSLKIVNNIWLELEDSTSYGFYYKTLAESVGEAEDLHKDTTIYINYIGRLLNGQVFDTTIADTAKVHNIYSTSKTYEPVSISMNEEMDDITMGDDESDIITGFKQTLWQMGPMEKGVGMFYSALGYGYSGSGSSIPAYAPLIFEIEIVEEPED